MLIHNVNYRITASQLNAFDWYIGGEEENALQDLLDAINGIDKPATEPQAKGKAFEHVINSCLDAPILANELKQNGVKTVIAEYKLGDVNFVFNFSANVIIEILDWLIRQGAHSQQTFYNRTITVANGLQVELYGYVDYLTPLAVVDLKTTSKYIFPKYANNWQTLVYGYLLGDCISSVDYLITDFSDTYRETYSKEYIKGNEGTLRSKLEHFIQFVEQYKDLIVNKKVFGQDWMVAKHSDCKIDFKFSEVV